MNDIDQYYKILRVETEATLEEIKQAYRKLAKQWHPDLFVNNPEKSIIAAEKFRQIQETYQVIKLGKVDSKPANTPSVKVKKASPNFYYDLGVMAAEDNDWQEALEYFSLAIKLDPEYWQAYIFIVPQF